VRSLQHLEPSVLDATATMFTSATVHSIDPDGATGDCLLIVGTRVAALGSPAECSAAAGALGITGERITEVDLAGATVVPGFIDPHAHPLMYGQMMSWVDCGPERASSIPEIV
jgi:predicted amidohydrolase YtcJ